MVQLTLYEFTCIMIIVNTDPVNIKANRCSDPTHKVEPSKVYYGPLFRAMPITDFGSPVVSALYFRAPVSRIVEDESYYESVKFTIQVPVPVPDTTLFAA